MDFEPFLAHWKTHKDCSDCTIDAYRSDLKMFQQFLDGIGIRRLNQVDHAIIDTYIKHMEKMLNPRFNRIGLSEASISRRLAAVSSYFAYVRATGNPKLRNPTDDLVRRSPQNDLPKPVERHDD